MKFLLPIILLLSFPLNAQLASDSWIRINLLGYPPAAKKIAVWCSKENDIPKEWELVDALTGKTVYKGKSIQPLGAYGPFIQTAKLDFSSYSIEGSYYIQSGLTRSPTFRIAKNVYEGTADFCLRYMRQQRSGFNPFLNDSCHNYDGYTLYASSAGLKDSTFINVSGGWHDASDYLQYSTTSANATSHLLMAYRDFPKSFRDLARENGLPGKNGVADILDEAAWGLTWLQKMNPSPNVMFNQVADDRDHISMRIPKLDSQYGRGFQRPVYFINGEPQQRGKFLNNTKGTSSTAAKFAASFALAYQIAQNDKVAKKIFQRTDFLGKAVDAYHYALKKPGVTQTVSVRSPYIYAEENWVDDMEFATASLAATNIQGLPGKNQVDYIASAIAFAAKEKVTPWLGEDTAHHYQWYPFINLGHYQLSRQLGRLGKIREQKLVNNYYREGILKVKAKASQNAFNRGIPFIWCSNNLTVAFAIQCYWYRKMTGDNSFLDLEQANLDWIFGCNPWGTSMVYGLPANGDTPIDPHSAFTHLKKYPIDGGLVDGPVYTSIYKNLIGIQLYEPDEYLPFQSNLAVYHDDYGDYSTNEPTMDGTASLIYLLAAMNDEANSSGSKTTILSNQQRDRFGAIIRADSARRNIAIVFSADEFGEGSFYIDSVLNAESTKASFFLTGRFYRNPLFKKYISGWKNKGHYLGAHSDQHLLYCDWTNRDSLLLTRSKFENDIRANYVEIKKAGINTKNSTWFLPPYEWYNDSIVNWTNAMGLTLVNFTPGTRSVADYTYPGLTNYQTSEQIFKSIIEFEKTRPAGLNGFILLMHLGTDPKRKDKFYWKLPELIQFLKAKGYHFQAIDQIFDTDLTGWKKGIE